MKIVIIALATLWCLASIGRAEVFIYKNKIRYTVTGHGGMTKVKAAGWTIVSDTGEVVQVLAYTSTKQFAVVPMQSITVNTVDAGGGKQYSFIIQHDIWTDDFGNVHIDTGGAKGLNADMTVNGATWSIPKSYTWAGRSMYPATSDNQLKFEESSGTFTFDKKTTGTSNSQGDDVNSASERLADSLLAKGYAQL